MDFFLILPWISMCTSSSLRVARGDFSFTTGSFLCLPLIQASQSGLASGKELLYSRADIFMDTPLHLPVETCSSNEVLFLCPSLKWSNSSFSKSRLVATKALWGGLSFKLITYRSPLSPIGNLCWAGVTKWIWRSIEVKSKPCWCKERWANKFSPAKSGTKATLNSTFT